MRGQFPRLPNKTNVINYAVLISIEQIGFNGA